MNVSMLSDREQAIAGRVALEIAQVALRAERACFRVRDRALGLAQRLGWRFTYSYAASTHVWKHNATGGRRGPLE